MKNIFTIILLLISLLAKSQSNERKILAKFIITDATLNGKDVTPILLNAGAYTTFYTIGNDGVIYMANVWPNSNSQSYGPMYSLEGETKEETYETYEASFFYFNWRYHNTYDGKEGTARVQLIKIYKKQGITFSMKIIPENLDITIYKGYMEGSVDFSAFDKTAQSPDTKNGQFRKDYNFVALFDMETEQWGDWKEGDNTFVINYNSNGDIAHYKPNGNVEVYKKISSVEEGYTTSGEHYQIITALDGNGNRFQFQFFDNTSIGLKLIYGNFMVQFSKR